MANPLAIPPLLLLVLLPCVAGAQVPIEADDGDYRGFDVRYGVASGAKLAALIERPALVSMAFRKFKDPETGERRLAGFGEVQGVYDVPFDALVAVLDDPTEAVRYSPRLIAARIEKREGPLVVMYQEVGIVFLGIKVGYRFRAEQVRDDLSATEVGYRIRLLESLDGNFFEAYTSWYAKQVLVGGRRLVYLRAYTRPGLRRPPIGTELILKSFTPGEMRSTLDRVVQEARRRAAKGRASL
jgi:hypothetical protein